MSEENSQGIQNIEVRNDSTDDRPLLAKNPSNSFDQKPIGGGSKMQFSQYPDQTIDPPKPPKKIVKPVKKMSKVVKVEQPQESETVVEIKTNNQIKEITQPKNTFDEAPIGKTNFNLSEFPEGEEQTQVVQTNFPMNQKLKSKAIKLRLSGLQDLLTLITEDPNSTQLSQVEISKLLKESNPACLEKILQCFKAWLQKNKEWGEQEARNAIENGYINGKPNTKKLTIEICDLMYNEKPDCVEMTILTGLKGKVPKTLAGYIAIITQLLAIYGVKRMKYLKPYLNDVVKVVTNQKLAAVKTEGTNLMKQAYKWLGKQVVQPMLTNLKQAIKKQLDTFWEGYDKTIVMTAPKDIADKNAQNGGKGNKKIDAYQLSDAVDVFKKFNEKWSQSVLKAQKWNQKVKLMQQFITAASVPKIANTDYRHVNDMIKRLINDSNFNVVLMDLKILATMSKGLRRPFSGVVKSLFSNVIGKFRDKKTQMIDQTFNTLNDFMYCISIQDVLDDIKEGLADKAPNMKVNLINWIGKFVEKKIEQKGQLPDKVYDALKSLFPIFEKLLSDGTSQVRQCMAKNIAKMKILINEDFFEAIENKMNKNLAIKVNQVKQNVKKMTSKQKDIKQNKGIQRDLSKSTLSLVGKDNQKNTKVTPNKKQDPQESRRIVVQNGGKVDISNDVIRLMVKMNDNNNWQNRKQGGQSLISLIYECNQKVTMNCVQQLMATLKIRINDTNKQLIKTFVQLTGIIFNVIPEKQVKNNGKTFICSLAQGLSDKNDINRRQISLALNKIGQAMGKQNLLHILGQYLQGDKDSRIEILNIILNNEDYLSKAQTKDYPKGIISCLCDKNKEIRNLGEKLLQKIVQKTGIQIFRNLASQQRPAFTKDLNSLFDKLQKGNTLNNSTIISKGVSPVRHVEKKMTTIPISSNRKNNKSLSKINKSFERQFENDNNQDLGLTKTKLILIEGDDYFAPIKILTNQRLQRQQLEQRLPWRAQDIKDNQQQQLKQQMQRLMRKQLVNKMLSFDYRKVVQSVIQIIKICKDLNQQSHIRQLYDIFVKWIFLRLWGGNPSIQSIVQVLPPIMSILQKKKLMLNDNDVELVIGVIREYFISVHMNEKKNVSQSLFTIIKCLIALSSGQKVLTKILKQFTIDLSSIHRHIKRQTSIFYKQGIATIIKTQMIQYIGKQDSLEQASKIKQLRNDQQFVDMLFRKYHQNVLTSYGFKQYVQKSRQKSFDRVSKHQNNNLTNNNSSAQFIVSTQNHPANIPNYNSNSRINTGKTIQQTTPHNSIPNSRTGETKGEQTRQHSASRKSNIGKTIVKKPQLDFDLNSYPTPNPCSPLGKNLAKLLPPNQATINFFAALFVENGQKISNELITHAKIIFGSILRSVIQMITKRNQYQPNKIINQINLLQQAIKCKNIINNIGELLYHCTNFALIQLVYEDENKALIYDDLRNRGIEFKMQNFIKAINGVMLRILQNGSPQQVISILFTLLTTHTRLQFVSHKTTCLIIKCIVRVAGSFAQNSKPQHIRDYFIKVNDYLNAVNLNISLEDFQPSSTQKIKPQESVISSIKNTLADICKIYKSQVWIHYQKAISESHYQDYHISPFITSLNIPYPQKSKTNNQMDELKKINQLLSKTKTFDAGIQKLKRYIDSNPQFIPTQYFSSLNYDQKFITMVMNSLQGTSNTSSIYRKTPNKSDIQISKSDMPSNDSNIQDKIKKLKMKYDQINPQKQQSTINHTSKRFEQQEKNNDRTQQIKRRIDQMKNKMTANNSYARPR